VSVKSPITTKSSITKREFVAAALAVGASGIPAADAASAQSAWPSEAPVRPFRMSFPDEALAELRRRVTATRWPDKEQVEDTTQGVQLATMKALAAYWSTDYDWRKCEAKLNALPQFVTTIDGLDIHFLHVRSKHADALPMIVTHGWPGSIIEQMKIIDPLTNPTANGGTAADAFHLVIPSLPGYGFSGKPTAMGESPAHRAGVGHADAAARLPALRCPGRRLGGNDHGCDGFDGAAGIARHSPQLAFRGSIGDR